MGGELSFQQGWVILNVQWRVREKLNQSWISWSGRAIKTPRIYRGSALKAYSSPQLLIKSIESTINLLQGVD